MFAPKVAKPQTKAAADSTNSWSRQRPTPVARQFGGDAVKQVRTLQGTIGNQATPRYLTQRLSNPPAKSLSEHHAPAADQIAQEASGLSWDFSRVPVFPTDRPNRFQAPSPFAAPPLPDAIHPKLVVGHVNDPLEHEADRVADQVMRMVDPDVSIAAAPAQLSRRCASCKEDDVKLQRKPAAHATATGTAPAIVHEALHSPGQPLSAETRAFMEPRFGRSLGFVRIHTDPLAADSATAVGALARPIHRVDAHRVC